jgi:ubiquinone biosynthesis protein UbiJ
VEAGPADPSPKPLVKPHPRKPSSQMEQLRKLRQAVDALQKRVEKLEK